MPGYGNEVTVAETSDNKIYMNSRNRNTAWFRLASYSSDGSQSWSAPQQRIDLVEPTCQGSVRSITTETGEHLMLFSNPASMRRERITVRLSENNGTTWSAGRRLYEGSAAYSDLVYLGDGWVGCLYERDWYDHLTFARFHLSWLRDSRVDHWTDQEVAHPSEHK
jgi:sialidase-1